MSSGSPGGSRARLTGRALVEDLRRALIATGLVSTVVIRPVAAEGESVDLAVALDRAPMRTIAGQAGYGTGEGIRVEASWQHRNLLPPEGAVTFRGVLGTQEQLVGVSLRRNNFLRRDQVLTAQFAVSHIDRAAYDARTTILSGAIERQTNLIWQKKWTWSAGAELVATDEQDFDLASGTTRRRTFFIGALPASLSYDGSNDLLDPTTGYRLAFRLSPEASLQSGAFGYARTQVDASLYQPFTPAVTLAGRIRLGTILGAQRDRIAPSRRFYAGGGGSVRGYGFQRLGPRDPVFDDPIGGRSLTEFALEATDPLGQLGDRAVPRRRQRLDLAFAQIRRSSLRRGNRSAIPYALRADPGRRRNAAQSAAAATAGWPSTSRSARPSDERRRASSRPRRAGAVGCRGSPSGRSASP